MEESKKVKLSELAELAKSCRDKLNEYISVSVIVDCHTPEGYDDLKISYQFYREFKGHEFFKKALDLKNHMESILND